MADDAPVRVDDLITAARRRFTWLAVVVLAQGVGMGWGSVQLIPAAPLVAGVGIGAAVGVAAFFLIREWGRRLDQRPRGLNLVRARTGAVAAFVFLPLGPLFALSLLARLRHPVLVRYAVANHPQAGACPDEELLVTIRARSAFVMLRTVGIVSIGVGVLGAVYALAVFLDFRDGVVIGGSLQVFLGVTMGAPTPLPVGVYAVACAIAGTRRLEGELASPADVRRLAWMVAPLVPIGPYVTWAVLRAIH